ncbi:hypothetical protein JCM8547_008397, partial [Rhodosporidiobolus lusitaniae]
MTVHSTSNGATAKQNPPIQLYHRSSQYRNWRYSKEELAKVRQELNEKAVERVSSLWEEER